MYKSKVLEKRNDIDEALTEGLRSTGIIGAASTGKTAILLDQLTYWAGMGCNVIFFTPEWAVDFNAIRLIAREEKVRHGPEILMYDVFKLKDKNRDIVNCVIHSARSVKQNNKPTFVMLDMVSMYLDSQQLDSLLSEIQKENVKVIYSDNVYTPDGFSPRKYARYGEDNIIHIVRDHHTVSKERPIIMHCHAADGKGGATVVKGRSPEVNTEELIEGLADRWGIFHKLLTISSEMDNAHAERT